MSDLHSETAPLPCASAGCTCQVIPGTGVIPPHAPDELEYCSEQCADPAVRGCGHAGCPCNDLV